MRSAPGRATRKKARPDRRSGRAWACRNRPRGVARSRRTRQRFDGKLNTVPSRTPADGQRCVMVLRFV
ncbi:hypothetical protein C7H84_04335 [Burkholderia sp. Nafp2/4-1b]|nr:hypothetical protein C7H84_04335 [Burkholderia sp. Nafp2/4-1b]